MWKLAVTIFCGFCGKTTEVDTKTLRCKKCGR